MTNVDLSPNRSSIPTPLPQSSFSLPEQPPAGDVQPVNSPPAVNGAPGTSTRLTAPSTPDAPPPRVAPQPSHVPGAAALVASGPIPQRETPREPSTPATSPVNEAPPSTQPTQVTGPATENPLYLATPQATVVAMRIQLSSPLPIPGSFPVPEGTPLLGALLIPNRVLVGDVAARIAAGDIGGALAASPSILTESSVFLSLPNPRGAVLPGRQEQAGAATVVTIPLNGGPWQFGAAAPTSQVLPNGGILFNNIRGRADGEALNPVNAGVVFPISGQRNPSAAIATGLEATAARNNNPANPATFVDDGFFRVLGQSIRNSAQFYLGAGWSGSLAQDEQGNLALSGANVTVTLDPDRAASNIAGYLSGRGTLPGAEGDTGAFPAASYATGAAIEGLGVLAAARGGPVAGIPAVVMTLSRLPGATDAALLDLGVAQGLYKIDTGMLLNDVRSGLVNNGDTAAAVAASYSGIIDRALQRGVVDADAEQIRDHLSQAMNYVGTDERETALVRLTAANIIGDAEVSTRENERLRRLDAQMPGGPPRAPSDTSTPGIGEGQSVGEYVTRQTQSTELTRDWTITDTTFGRLGGRTSPEGWISRSIDTGIVIRETAPDTTEREARIGIVEDVDGRTRFTASRAEPGEVYRLPATIQTPQDAARYVEQAIARGEMQNARVTDQPRSTVSEILETPLTEGGAANRDRVEALWDNFTRRVPGFDGSAITDFVVDTYNSPDVTRAQRLNSGVVYYEDELTPARILNGTIFASPGDRIAIPPEAEGRDDILSASEIAPAFRAMRDRLRPAEYQDRVNEAAAQLYEAGFPLNFGVRELADALTRLERERGPVQRHPDFDAIAPLYRPR